MTWSSDFETRPTRVVARPNEYTLGVNFQNNEFYLLFSLAAFHTFPCTKSSKPVIPQNFTSQFLALALDRSPWRVEHVTKPSAFQQWIFGCACMVWS